MPLYTTLASLSQTAASNAADGSVDAPSTIDQQTNLLASFIAQLRDGLGFTGQLGNKNRVINGAFQVNQRVVTGSVVLAAGAYGHDRWKGGAAGCTYTFTTSGLDTTITISAGSLIQVIEAVNVEGGNYAMSWTGTAQGKIGGGAFSASGVTATGVTSATNLNIEFNTGTLSKVQLEPGLNVTAFERRPFATELVLCQRYFLKTFNYANAPVQNIGNSQGCLTATYTVAGGFRTTWCFPVEMRTAPSVTSYNPFAANSSWRGVVGSADYAASASIGIGTRQMDVGAATSAASAEVYIIHLAASAEL